MWSSKPREGLAICRAKAVPSFLSYFKTLSVGPAPGIEPAAFRSAIKRSNDCAVNPIYSERSQDNVEVLKSSNLLYILSRAVDHVGSNAQFSKN